MYLESPAYRDGETMPARFAAVPVPGGVGVSVPLEWGGEPAGTRSFALAMIDHHPIAHDWVHWLIVDIPATVHALPEGASMLPSMPAGATELVNSGGRLGYGGPRPPAGSGPHDYILSLYALDATPIGVEAGESWDEVHAAIKGHVLDSATLMGAFEQ